MKRIKEFEIPLSDEDVIDVRIIIKGGEIIGFALNLRCKLDDIWYAVYRVDTAHGYLHEQRFWISPEPMELPTFKGLPMQYIFDHFMNHIKQNYERFRRYYIERMRLNYGI